MNDPITEDELAAMERRATEATKGPWESFVEGRDHLSGDDFNRTGGLDDESPGVYVTLSLPGESVPAGPADLDFIAAAREDVPRLIAEVRRLRHLVG